MKKITLFSVGGILFASLLIGLIGMNHGVMVNDDDFSQPEIIAQTPEQTESKAPSIAEGTAKTEESVEETTVLSESDAVLSSSESADSTAEETLQETTESISKNEESAQAPTVYQEEVKPAEHGITIGSYQPSISYDCGTPDHHCANAQTHTLLTDLAEKGCVYCGSHTCLSFYAVDEWGQGCYDATKCPSYDVYADPCCYCQDCGKPCGDGQNGTCAVYNIDITCPNCGEYVKAWSCHSCG